MKFTTDSFISGVVAVVVAIVVLCMVAIPIIGEATTGMEDGPIKTIINILPVFIAIGVLVACVTLFMSKKA